MIQSKAFSASSLATVTRMETWTSYVEFGRRYRETHPQFTSHRKLSTAIWLQLRKQNGCSDTKYSHKISCKFWPRQFHDAVASKIAEWKQEHKGSELTQSQPIKTKRKSKIFRPIAMSESQKVKSKRKRKLDSKAKGKTSQYAKSFAHDLEMEDNEIFPVLRKMKKRDLIRYCKYYKLRHSAEQHRDTLLSIATKHFIKRSRMNKQTSIEFMEEELFWHSVAHQSNAENCKSQ